MKEIKLTQGMVAFVDDADYEYLNQWKWYTRKTANTSYAQRGKRTRGKLVTINMHRLILGLTDPNELCDHIDGNGLNNRRSNIRKCTVSQNAMNRRVQKNNKLGINGVRFDPVYKKYGARITTCNNVVHIGFFDTSNEVKEARIIAEKRYHKEFARDTTIKAMEDMRRCADEESKL